MFPTIPVKNQILETYQKHILQRDILLSGQIYYVPLHLVPSKIPACTIIFGINIIYSQICYLKKVIGALDRVRQGTLIDAFGTSKICLENNK